MDSNAILSDPPCPYAPANPFGANTSEYNDGIHWLSPTQFPRMDIGQVLPLRQVPGCENGCQINDIRERPHWEVTAGALKDYRVEDQLFPFQWEYALRWKNAAHDAANNTDCYWRGVYFFTDTNFTSALTRKESLYPSKEDYTSGVFLCPKN